MPWNFLSMQKIHSTLWCCRSTDITSELFYNQFLSFKSETEANTAHEPNSQTIYTKATSLNSEKKAMARHDEME